MTDKATGKEQVTGNRYDSRSFSRSLTRRRRRERWLRLTGILSVAFAVGMLLVLFGSILWQSRTAFVQTQILLPIQFDSAAFVSTEEADIRKADYRSMLRAGLYERLGRPEGRSGRRAILELVSNDSGYQLMQRVLADPGLIGQRVDIWFSTSDDVHNVAQGAVPRPREDGGGRVSLQQLAWMDQLEREGFLHTAFARDLFLNSDSREPEIAGIFGGVVGSALMLVVTLAVSLPLGVAAAVYLEEFAPKNRITEFIDVNIRNLAAVPSIVFGLLALAVFIRVFGMPRSSPLVGGLALSLLTLPTMIIAARAAIEAVPPSLRFAALELGASEMQTVWKVVLPNALPGILTGTIISMAEALGETAPLLMIGMIAFVADPPTGFLDPAAPLPVQIYSWSTSPERAFAAKTAAAIIVLLLFLFLMNATAIYIRDRLQKRW